ncbi:hypothetical protein [Dyadobacter sp.]|uniref:hypothetical protein n=1 Tax=Dyadobacter sp. TaxID=1914288 RepID=UPI003F71CACE
MNLKQQIKQDVALLSERAETRSELLNFLQNMKMKMDTEGNLEQVLAHAGSIDDLAANEMAEIISIEFGKIDAEWE